MIGISPPRGAARLASALSLAALGLGLANAAHAGAMRPTYKVTALPLYPSQIDNSGNILAGDIPQYMGYRLGDANKRIGPDGQVTPVGVTAPRGSRTTMSLGPSGTVAVSVANPTGALDRPDIQPTQHLLIRDGVATDISGAFPRTDTVTGRDSTIIGVNSRGDLAGYTIHDEVDYPKAGADAFIARAGADGTLTYQNLGTLGGSYAWVRGINEAGQVFGESSTAADGYHPFISQEVGGVTTLKDLGSLGGRFGAAMGMNDRGEVVGASEIAGQTLPGGAAVRFGFLYKDGALHAIAPLTGDSASAAIAINNAGDLVGQSYRGDLSYGLNASNSRAFIRYADGAIADLNDLLADPAWHMLDAVGIDDQGRIIGTAVSLNGISTSSYIGTRIGVLLTPIADRSGSVPIDQLPTPAPTPDPVPVPEPSTFAIFAAAGAGLWYARWGRHRGPNSNKIV